MMKPEPAPIVCSLRLPKRRRNSRPSGVSRNSGGSSLSTSPPDTVSVTAMFTTDGSTRLTSGEKLSGVERAMALPGTEVQAVTRRARASIASRGPLRRRWGRQGFIVFGSSRRIASAADGTRLRQQQRIRGQLPAPSLDGSSVQRDRTFDARQLRAAGQAGAAGGQVNIAVTETVSRAAKR